MFTLYHGLLFSHFWWNPLSWNRMQNFT
jgi:hypothetical protein